MRIINYLLWIMVILIGVSFAVLNAQATHFNYFINEVQLPLSLMLVLAFALGGVLGVFASLLMIIKYKKEAHYLKRQLKQHQAEKKTASSV